MSVDIVNLKKIRLIYACKTFCGGVIYYVGFSQVISLGAIEVNLSYDL